MVHFRVSIPPGVSAVAWAAREVLSFVSFPKEASLVSMGGRTTAWGDGEVVGFCR